MLLVLLLLVAGSAYAQKGKLREAKKLLEQKAYQGAIDIYMRILDKNSKNPEAIAGIAECYYRMRNFSEAEYWYYEVVQNNPSPEAWLYHAKSAHAIGNNKKALKSAQQAKRLNPTYEVEFLIKALNEETIANLKTSGALYTVEPVKALNTPQNDYCAVVYKDNQIVFMSDRENDKKFPASKRIDAWTNNNFTDIYIADRTLTDAKKIEYSYGKSKKMEGLCSKNHDGPVSFSADGGEAYFSTSSREGRSPDGVWRIKIYRSLAQGKDWSKPQGVAVINSDDYSVYHPTLSAKGTKLIFAAEMPGGAGGLDLYYCELEDGRWTPPTPLVGVNTEGNEAFPFLHPDGTLYFASDGHIGLGGYDIYMSKENMGDYFDPVNLGYPINTSDDDFAITMNKEKTYGYISSNRPGGAGGDDIYWFKKSSIEVEVLVYDSLSGMPLEGAEVFTPCSAVKSFVTNPDGKVFMEIAMDKACDFAAEKNPYKPNSRRAATKDLRAGETLIVQIPLTLERFFDLQGTVVDGYTKVPVEAALVTLISNCGKGLDSSTVSTNAEGKYEFKELGEGCNFQLKVSKIGYTGDIITFSTDSVSSDTIVRFLAINCFGPNCKDKADPNPNPGPQRKDIPDNIADCKTVKWKKGKIRHECLVCPTNDTIFCIECEIINKVEVCDTIWQYKDEDPVVGPKELIHIFYDYDDASLRADAQPGLKRLLRLMREYPEAKILISSHTDARGSRLYNQRLSNRRAHSVVVYLIANGIDKKRLKAKGMGEEVMINDCYDGKECPEEQHQENRRTEFQVYEYDKGSGEIKSRRPDNIRTAPCRNCPKAGTLETDTPAPSDTPIDTPPTSDKPTTEKPESDKDGKWELPPFKGD